MTLFNELGEKVEELWAKCHYHALDLPKIAADLLQKMQINKKLAFEDVLKDFLNSDSSSFPRQLDVEANFGDPPLTLYCGGKFTIDMNIWVHSTTSIHQHAFSGAFQVFRGSSLHSHYAFRQRHKINESLLLGDVLCTKAEILQEGDIREIWPGWKSTHSLFHLQVPSQTLIIRSRGNPAFLPQLSLYLPSVCIGRSNINNYYVDPFVKRKFQLLNMLSATEHSLEETFRENVLRHADLGALFEWLLSDFLYDLDFLNLRFYDLVLKIDDLLAPLKGRDERIFKAFSETCKSQTIQFEAARIRSTLEKDDYRLLFALLLNINQKEKIYEALETLHRDVKGEAFFKNTLREMTHSFDEDDPDYNVFGLERAYADFFADLICNSLSFEELLKLLEEKNIRQNYSIEELEILYKEVTEISIFKSMF